jgi:hypothetical protein
MSLYVKRFGRTANFFGRKRTTFQGFLVEELIFFVRK